VLDAGRLEQATQLARAADEARGTLGYPALPRDRARRAALQRSIAAALDPARVVERAMTIDDAVEAARAALSA
jgi:hypothetical protein